MDEAAYKERVKRLKEVDRVIKSLDPAIRETSFKLLECYVTAAKPRTEPGGSGQTGAPDATSAERFFTAFEHEKPSDNALLIAAYFYSQYGAAAFSVDEAREMGDAVGLTIPSRLDMTYLSFQRKSKTLFKRGGKGQFKPTVHGETYLKDTYGITKGTRQKKPASADQ